jgi:protoheme IX farnesyltransferase
VHPVVGFAAILFIAVGGGRLGRAQHVVGRRYRRGDEAHAQAPIPAGRVTPERGAGFGWRSRGLGADAGARHELGRGGLLAFTIFFYAVIYTMWLKRWTPQNIVIGGAAGAFPPMIGWAARPGRQPRSVLMFALIFMWTPPHFWALALFMRSDYDDAGVPMLTVTHGRRATRAHILVYTVLLAPFAIGTGFTAVGGPVYLAVAVVLNALFLKGAWDIWRRDEAGRGRQLQATEKSVFRSRSIYLFAAFRRDRGRGALRPLGWGGWAMG